MMIKTEGFLLDDVTSTSRSTSYSITTRSLDSSTGHSCGNKLNTCSQYGPSVCTTAAYQPWAKDNCALYCNFCISPDLQNFCKDKIDNCVEYDSGDLCTNPTYYTWMYDNCRDYCRLDTCGNTCLDSPSANCTMLNATIGLCSSIHHAKVICRNYCDLCNVTDGHWCAWSDWGSCDATCANGTQSRTRQCGCPAASNGGLDCVGNVNSDSKPCTNNPCPVNGGWSVWANWGSCSSTCGIGMQRRDRRCSNPSPSMGGLQCLGDAHMDRICFASACEDGNWTDWGSWSACNKQCGGGTRTRSRTCTNPRPSLTGRYCDGDSSNVKVCNIQSCKPEGGTTNIRLVNGTQNGNGRLEVFHNNTWGTVCNDGFDNDAAAVVCHMLGYTGQSSSFQTNAAFGPGSGQIWLDDVVCSGDETSLFNCQKAAWGYNNCVHSEDVGVECNSNNIMVAFTAYGSQTGTPSSVIRFPNTIVNYHSDYITSTGKFTCSIAGLYHFAVTLTKRRDDIDMITANLKVNGNSQVTLHADPSDDGTIDSGSYSVSGAATLHLSVGDDVYISGTATDLYNSRYTFFTGFLIHANK